MAASRFKNKVLQRLYKPRKSKSMTFKEIDAMEKALESIAAGFTGKKEKK